MNRGIGLIVLVAIAMVSACSKHAGNTSSSKIQALQAAKSAKGWTFSLKESEHSRYLDSLGSVPNNVQGMSEHKSMASKTSMAYLDSPISQRPLPKAWDWRWFDVVTNIKNQGTCGSCWAFGSVAAMESAIMIQTGRRDVNLSEQQLLSCSGYGTCGGGTFAMGHFLSHGAMYESDFPYQGGDVQCNATARENEKAADWGSVGGEGGDPSVDQIKRAIYDFGPVAATVAASDSWYYYDGGIYNACDSNVVNHIVVIIGWDDKDQVWIIKNSWGADWGEKGYMRMKWQGMGGSKCNSIGQEAAYVVFDPKFTRNPNVPSLNQN